ELLTSYYDKVYYKRAIGGKISHSVWKIFQKPEMIWKNSSVLYRKSRGVLPYSGGTPLLYIRDPLLFHL
ncbi:MAG: hypothetical protein WCG31_10685, partial [Deltaproteobacteria bacterium]